MAWLPESSLSIWAHPSRKGRTRYLFQYEEMRHHGAFDCYIAGEVSTQETPLSTAALVLESLQSEILRRQDVASMEPLF